jgi:hypothetical protein
MEYSQNKQGVGRMMKRALLLGVYLGSLVFTGCLSSNPGSTSLAYVMINKASPEAIQTAAISVFQDEYYTLVEQMPTELVFERTATQQDRARWGRYGEQGMRMRVVVVTEVFPNGDTLLRADAYILRARGVEPITPVGRRPYMKLLKEVRKKTVKS